MVRDNTQTGAFADAESEQQLGLPIDPGEVRLITGPDEPYNWSYMPDKAHLFQKHLSKHTMGACVTLFDEVGKTFEATRTNACRADERLDRSTEVDASFTTKIERLEHEHARLQHDHAQLQYEHIGVVEACERWQARATENVQLRASAENEFATKKADLESAQSIIEDLRRQLQVASESLEVLQQQKASAARGVREITEMLDIVSSRLCPDAELLVK